MYVYKSCARRWEENARARIFTLLRYTTTLLITTLHYSFTYTYYQFRKIFVSFLVYRMESLTRYQHIRRTVGSTWCAAAASASWKCASQPTFSIRSLLSAPIEHVALPSATSSFHENCKLLTHSPLTHDDHRWWLWGCHFGHNGHRWPTCKKYVKSRD